MRFKDAPYIKALYWKLKQLELPLFDLEQKDVKIFPFKNRTGLSIGNYLLWDSTKEGYSYWFNTNCKIITIYKIYDTLPLIEKEYKFYQMVEWVKDEL